VGPEIFNTDQDSTSTKMNPPNPAVKLSKEWGPPLPISTNSVHWSDLHQRVKSATKLESQL
jgi:hypothetical protein